MSTSDVARGSEGATTHAPSIWWSRKALGLHATIVVLVPVFTGLFWWQVQRVREGNTLSWAYVFEWPFFTGYAVYLWWKLIHDQAVPVVPREASSATRPSGSATSPAPATATAVDAESDVDEELAAYNRYLAELHASGRRKRW